MRAGKMQSIAKTAEAWRVPIIPDMTCLTADTAEGLSDIWRRHEPTTEWFRYMSRSIERIKEGSITSIGIHFERMLALSPVRKECLRCLTAGFLLVNIVAFDSLSLRRKIRSDDEQRMGEV